MAIFMRNCPNKNGDFRMGSDDGRSGFGEVQLFRRPEMFCFFAHDNSGILGDGIQHHEIIAIPYQTTHICWFLPFLGGIPKKKGAGIPRVFVVLWDGSNDMAIIWFIWFLYYPLVTSSPFFTIWL